LVARVNEIVRSFEIMRYLLRPSNTPSIDQTIKK
jgi:hypothetical protein